MSKRTDLPPEGWYDDPDGQPGRERRWDGAAWTDEWRDALKRPPGGWYQTEVNKGSINMRTLEANLNRHRASGYRLHTLIEQAGNTIIVFEWAGE